VLLVCIVIQVFFAGAGLFKDDSFLEWHKNFVHAFEFLPLLMAIAAGIAKRWPTMWMCITLLILIEAQYPLAPFNPDTAGTWAAAFHPVNAILITILTVVVLLHRPPWRKTA
jgi:hypothetical protein